MEFTTIKALNSAIKEAGGADKLLVDISSQIKATGQALNNLTHAGLMVGCLGSSVKYGGDDNWNRVETLLGQMPRGSRVESMILWLKKFWAVRIKYDAGKYEITRLKKKALKEHGGDDAAAAVKHPWYDLHEKRKGGKRPPITLETLASRVLKLAQNAANDGIDPGQIEAMLHEIAGQAGEIQVSLVASVDASKEPDH